MDLELTVVAADTGARADIWVRAPDSAAADVLAAELLAAVGAAPDALLTVDGRPLATTGRLAHSALRDGCVVTALPPGAVRSGDPPSPPAETAAAMELQVTAGPDAGRRLALADGEYVAGRDAGCGLVIDDAAVSRRQLRLTVTGAVVTVTDLSSANGTTLAGRPVSATEPAAVAPGVVLAAGGSELRVVAVPPPAPELRLPSGRLAVARPPRIEASPAAVHVTFPPPPVAPVRTRIPLLAAAAPMVAGVVLAVVLHQWQLLAFTALSPVMVMSQAASERWHGRRTTRAATREHTVATAAATDRLAVGLAAERDRRERAVPSVGELTAAAAHRSTLLWHRGIDDADALQMRLGRGDIPADLTVTGGPAAVLREAAVHVDLRRDSVLGICGPAARTTGLLRSLLVQAAVLHEPEQLAIVVIAPGRGDEWAWARWLPHTTPRRGESCRALVGFDLPQARQRVAEVCDGGRNAGRHVLVIVDATMAGDDPAALAALGRLLTDDTADATEAARPRSVIWSAPALAGLPSGCVATIDLTAVPANGAPVGEATIRRRGAVGPSRVAPDLMSAEVAEATARALAPLRSHGTEASRGLPRTVAWRRTAALDLDDAAAAARALARTWVAGPSTRVTLGVDAAGPVTVDLCRDGPHALIAGTTGAGKSELLLTLVAGLVAGSRPAELSLLLIDHKGGATFDPCARLPHTVGVITDLDAASTRRALMSLTAELRRRERLLSGAGATDVEGYLAARGPADEPLARLVIIIDEFAALADEQPDFIGGLVAIAARGRSLGIHLVLATQRPEGVVSADIRANTRLRICLGVARENESRDVIDSPAAAAISRATPGRGFLRIGPGELREFQSAQVRCGAARRNAPLVTQAPAALLGLLELGHAVTEAPPGSGSHTDLDLLVDAACTAAAATGCRATAPPWLPPLPSLLTPAALPPATRPRGVVWGLVDLPALGQQHPLELDLSAGATTVITGTARSGRTTAATAIALAASAACPPDELRLWAIDAGSGLADLGRLPHCGAVVPATDPDGVERLLDYLGQEAADRRRRAGGTDPVLMLLIDSWEAIATGHDRAAQRVADQLLRLVADAPACGLHLVVTTDRGGLTGRLPATATDRVVLRLADPSELTLIGVAAKEIPRRLPAGRGFRGSDAAAIQVAADDGSMRRAAMAWPTARRPARRFDPLPARLSINDARIRGGSGPPRIVLGLAADDLAPVSLDPADIGTSFLVAGPPGSGRTGALQLLARQLDGRRVAVCCHFGSPLLDEPGVVHLPAYDQEQAAAVLDAMRRGTPGGVDVVVDDADLLAEGPLWRPLEQLIRGESGQPCVVAMAGSTDALAAAYRGPVALARRGRTGLLLHPSRAQDGELLGVRLPARLTSSGPPGRGWVALRGTATPLQLAYVPAASRESAASETAYADDAGRSLRDCSAERTWLRPDRFEA